MYFEIARDALLKPLQVVASGGDRRPSQPILANVLLSVENNNLLLLMSDDTLELSANVPLTADSEAGSITVPARKFLDICRALPESAVVKCTLEENKVLLRSGRSRFSLTTIPADDFPRVGDIESTAEVVLEDAKLRSLIEQTHFSMAQQDVRYYLNGLLLSLKVGRLVAVATDGHRIAMSQMQVASENTFDVIVPRKSVTELLRMLDSDKKGETSQLIVSKNHIRVKNTLFCLSSKLIEGRFPDYDRVLPKKEGKCLQGDRDALKEVFSRAAVLSSDKHRVIRMRLQENVMRVWANNLENEQSEDEIDIVYKGDEMDISFNVGYLMDVLSVLPKGDISMSLTSSASGALIESVNKEQPGQYVIMPLQM